MGMEQSQQKETVMQSEESEQKPEPERADPKRDRVMRQIDMALKMAGLVENGRAMEGARHTAREQINTLESSLSHLMEPKDYLYQTVDMSDEERRVAYPGIHKIEQYYGQAVERIRNARDSQEIAALIREVAEETRKMLDQ